MAEVPGSIPTGGNTLLLIFYFHVVKPLMPILPILCISENPEGDPEALLIVIDV